MKKMPISCFTWRFTQSYHFFYFYLWGWFWLQHLLIAARIVKVPELLPFPNIFPNLKSEWIQYIIINSIQKLHVPFFLKKCYQNSETQLTLKSRMPSLWNAHLALAWTKRLGIFLPEFLQRFLHHQSSVSNLSVWIFVWRRPPCTTGWAKKKNNTCGILFKKKWIHSFFLNEYKMYSFFWEKNRGWDLANL